MPKTYLFQKKTKNKKIQYFNSVEANKATVVGWIWFTFEINWRLGKWCLQPI